MDKKEVKRIVWREYMKMCGIGTVLSIVFCAAWILVLNLNKIKKWLVSKFRKNESEA